MRVRRNISVLLGAGGNIAVLTGPDGKLLVDAEIVTARPNVSKGLTSINADPIKQLIKLTGISTTPAETSGSMRLEPISWRMRTRANIFPRPRASKATGGTLPSRADGCDSLRRLQRRTHSACQQHDSDA